jgi:general secretion pathway protein I
MPTCVPTGSDLSFRRRAPEAGFTLIEMLVAMLLLSLVGLTLARFQTFQIRGAASLAASAAARLAADNLAIDLLVAPAAPVATERGVVEVGGRPWHWQVTPAPPPDPALMPELVRLDIAVSTGEGAPPVATRSLIRPRGNPPAIGSPR